MPAFSSGEYAQFLCDRCGFTGKYRDSVKERMTGLRIHARCEDEPLIVRRLRAEPQALRDPRPDDYEIDDALLAAWSADAVIYTMDSTAITADGGL